MPAKTWVNFHNHTTYSMLDGHGTTERYAARAKELGMPALAITDHGNVHGWLDHYDHCLAVGIKPVLGIEAYQARKSRLDRDEEERAGPSKNEWDQRGPYHLGILAKNLTGYNNVIKLSSRAYTEGYYVKPRLDLELLSEHSEGIIVLSGCLGGAVQQALLRGDFDAALGHAATMQDIVGKDNYFIELQDHDIEEQRRVKEDTIRIANMIGAKIVATGDCHYVMQSDAKNHDVMLCAGTKATIFDENRFKFHEDGFFLHSYDEMAAKFDTEWLDNTVEIAEMIDVKLEFNELHFPKFPDVPKEKTPEEFLEEQVWAGIKERYGDPIPDEVRERTEYELGVVNRMGFTEYFLVVGDLVRWARDNKIRTGWGRGSAAGSILSYALRITNLDPIRFGLMFERFLIEGRLAPPDIDLDFDSRYRDKVIEYAKEKYGYDHVANICSFFSVGARQAVRDAARVLGHDYGLADTISKLMPPPVLGVSKSLEESIKMVPDLRKIYDSDPAAKEILDAALGLEGIYRQTGVHAAGVVITPKPLTEYLPVMQKGEGQPLLTQWDMHRTEEVGVLKVDFLALRNLDVIDMAVENIEKRYGVVIDTEDIPIDDTKIYEELSKGDTMGVFQMESPGMVEMTVAVRPEVFEDIMAIQSLYRPGPMGSGMDKMFVNRKHGRQAYSVPHPLLDDILRPSHGIMLYQEDVLNTTRAITGWGAGEADNLRKAIGKKQLDKIGSYREKFVSDAQVQGIDKGVSNKIYSDIEYFAGYGFNRAHAASYSMVSYVTAWFKSYYPAEYMAACLTSMVNKKDRLTQYLNQCRKMNINIIPPSVDVSYSEFTVTQDGDIVFGLSAIEGLGDKLINPLLSSRPEGGFKTLYGFMRDADKSILNKGAVEHLMRAGALDTLVWFEPEMSLARDAVLEMLEEEKAEIGLYVTDHPLSDVAAYMEPNITHTIADLATFNANQSVKLGGLLRKVTKRYTKLNKMMYVMEFEDLTGDISVVAFPKQAEKIPDDLLQEGRIGILTGRVSKEVDENGDSVFIKMVYGHFEPLQEASLDLSPPIILRTESRLSPKQIGRINDIIEGTHGTSHVFLEMSEGTHTVTFKFKKATAYEIKETLEHIVNLNEALNG